MRSEPSELQLDAAGSSGTTPFTRTVIVGSKRTITAPSPQTLGGVGQELLSWSDGGAQSHDVTVGTSPTTYTATYRAAAASPTKTFLPTADARVAEASPGTNYGTSSTLRADGGSDPEVESNLKFTVSGLTGSVTSAKLQLHTTTATDSATANGPAVYRTGTGWTETGLTWSNRPARTSAVLDDKGALAANTWVEYNLNAAGITGNGDYAFTVVGTSSDGTDFSSRQATSLRPELIISTG